jgi:hypothetical protein
VAKKDAVEILKKIGPMMTTTVKQRRRNNLPTGKRSIKIRRLAKTTFFTKN